MRFYRIVIPPCPTMKDILRNHEHVGFRLSKYEVIHILVGKIGKSADKKEKGSTEVVLARGHGIRLRRYHKGRYLVMRSKGCLLRDVLSSFYVNSIRITREGIIAIVSVPDSEATNFLDRISRRCRASVEELSINPVLTEEENRLLGIARGLYEAPRKVSFAELSAKLGIPKSSLSYKLRRALRKLLITIP